MSQSMNNADVSQSTLGTSHPHEIHNVSTTTTTSYPGQGSNLDPNNERLHIKKQSDASGVAKPAGPLRHVLHTLSGEKSAKQTNDKTVTNFPNEGSSTSNAPLDSNIQRPNEGDSTSTHMDSWSQKSLYGGPITRTQYHTDGTAVSHLPGTSHAPILKPTTSHSTCLHSADPNSSTTASNITAQPLASSSDHSGRQPVASSSNYYSDGTLAPSELRTATVGQDPTFTTGLSQDRTLPSGYVASDRTSDSLNQDRTLSRGGLSQDRLHINNESDVATGGLNRDSNLTTGGMNRDNNLTTGGLNRNSNFENNGLSRSSNTGDGLNRDPNFREYARDPALYNKNSTDAPVYVARDESSTLM